MPPGLADKGGVPPGLADKGGVPPGLAAIDVAGSPGGADARSPQTTLASGGGSASESSASTTDLADAGDEGSLQKAANTRSNLASLHPDLLELSRSGMVVRKGEILAISPNAASRNIIRRLDFQVNEQLHLTNLGLSGVVLRAPAGLTADEALARLQAADPHGRYALNPIYERSGRLNGARLHETALKGPRPIDTRPSAVIGLIDTGVYANHPSLTGVPMEQAPFAPGGLTPASHGTAVASIIAGHASRFQGVAPNSKLYVADVYGHTMAGGAASSIAEAINWLVSRGAPVINVSLVGPPNELLRAAVGAAIARGVIVVAAVGNDGPNSPPLYPAAYPGVVAVTGVDAKQHILLEAVRTTPVSFAAPGAEFFAADGSNGYAKVRGTSFAAPIVAGRLALLHQRPGRADALAAIEQLKRSVKAPPTPNSGLGFGIVGQDRSPSPRPELTPVASRAVARRAE